MLMGFYLCCTHMQSNILRYLRFQSQEHFIYLILNAYAIIRKNSHARHSLKSIKLKKERPSINKNHKITFPKVTLCLNSMHSKQALEEYPSDMEENYNLRTVYIIRPTHFATPKFGVRTGLITSINDSYKL